MDEHDGVDGDGNHDAGSETGERISHRTIPIAPSAPLVFTFPLHLFRFARTLTLCAHFFNSLVLFSPSKSIPRKQVTINLNRVITASLNPRLVIQILCSPWGHPRT